MVDWLSRLYKGFTGLRSAFTMAGGGQATPVFGLMARRIAFTMAEILLSLTIIGVVAAITLPSLTGNINERTWNTQRKALFSRLSQAVALMPQVRGYGEFSNTTNEYGETMRVSDNATEAFLTAGLAKVLKINNICDKDHLSDCGLPEQIVRIGSVTGKFTVYDKKWLSDYTPNAVAGCWNGNLSVDTTAAAFETANGESILTYYNPVCLPDKARYYESLGNYPISPVIPSMCANFVYDLNGKRGPNTVGKDIGFMSLFYAMDSILVAPLPLSKNSSASGSYDELVKLCSSQEARIPNKEEMMSIYVNEYLMDDAIVGQYIYYITSSTDINRFGQRGRWVLETGTNGYATLSEYNNGLDAGGITRCIKRD